MFLQKYTIIKDNNHHKDLSSYYTYADDETNWVLANINFKYINYYIQEINNILENKRTNDLIIHVTDDEELSANIPDDYVVVNKFNVCAPEDQIDSNFPNNKLSTIELKEFLEFIKKDQKIGDEVVVDKRL